MTPSVPSLPTSSAGEVVAGVVLQQPAGRSITVPSASTASRPATLRAHRPVAHRARAAGVGGDDAADGGAVARAEVDAGVEAGVARVRLQRGERDAGARLDLRGAAVDRAERRSSRAQAEHDLAAARNAGADQPGVAALRHDRARRARAQAPAPRRPARCRPGRTTARAAAAVAPGPVDLEGRAQVLVGQHVGVADGVGEILHEAVGHTRHATVASGVDGSMTAARDHESVFTLEATPIKFGPGAAADAGWELKRLGVTRALLVTDPGVAATGHPDRVRAAIEAEGIEVVVYDGARVEPTLDSLQEAADCRARRAGRRLRLGRRRLEHRHGEGRRPDHHPPGAGHGLRQPAGGRGPQAAVAAAPAPRDPDHLGTGREATTVAVLDIPELKVKTGISHRYLRPAQGIVDPEFVRTLPAQVTSSTGLDVICHAAESYLARPYDARERPASPDERPPYQGANPVADVWSAQALEYGGRFLRRAVADADDLEARGAMMLAATMAGVGFGSAGVHIPHACAYPIAGLKHAYQPPGYPDDHPFVPARPLGDRHRARRVPLHLRGGARAPPPASPSCWPASRRAPGPTPCPTCCAR